MALPILVIGAGPTGLMLACALARLGINFRIIDKKKGPTIASNATWLQTRTIELLDHLGAMEKFKEKALVCDAINLHADGKYLSQLSFKAINSPFPFVFMLSQHDTEQLLVEHLQELNHKIEWSIELCDIECDEERVKATLKDENGNLEFVTSDWVVACDGANSLVRQKCGFHFPGEDLQEQFIVADAKIDFTHMSDQIHYFFEEGKILTAFPLGDQQYRLAANLHVPYSRKIFTSLEVIELVQERAHGKYYVSDVNWQSLFWIHSKLVKKMRKGRIFLAGDAAHIHSPAGGQGMNMGLQDAYNLAWKLAFVLNKKAKATLLDSYQDERYPIAEQVVFENESVTKLALSGKKFMTQLKKFTDKIAKSTKLAGKLSNHITQLDIEYKNSPIINYDHQNKLYKPGMRVPDAIFQGETLYHYLSKNKQTILFFSGTLPSRATITEINDMMNGLEQQFGSVIKTIFISPELDLGLSLHHYLQIKKPCIFIARPDCYIAYYSEVINIKPIQDYLGLIFFDKDRR